MQQVRVQTTLLHAAHQDTVFAVGLI